ncbi:MAG: mechanosensitive ion channel family protein [Myxococcota bacterium]
MHRWVFTAAAVLGVALSAPAAHENPSSPQTAAAQKPAAACSTPRQAVASWLQHIQPENYDATQAVRCMQRPHGMSAEELATTATHLKQLFEWRGIRINLNKIPDTPNYMHPKTGGQQVILHHNFPNIWVEKSPQGSWTFPAQVMAAVPQLYEKTLTVDLRGWLWMLPEWAKQDILGIEGITLWQIAALALLVLLGMLIRVMVTSVVVSRVEYILSRFSGLHWGRDLLGSAATPLGNLAMAAFLAFFIPSLALNVHLAQWMLMAVRVLAAVSCVMVLYGSIDIFTAWIADRMSGEDSGGLDAQLVPLMSRGLKIITVILGVIFVLQNLDVNVTSLLAGVTVGGLAISFAAQETVSNLFGSFTVITDKPFSVGDWIITDGVEGIVETIGFRSTRVRTFYNSLVTIPNNKFTKVVVDNKGLRIYRRCYIVLQLRMDTTPQQIEAFCNGVRAILKAHPKTRKDYYEVHFNDYGPSSFNIMLYFFMKVPSWSEELRTRHEILLDILRLCQKLDVQFAYPTQTLHVEQMATSEKPAQPSAPPNDQLQNAVQAFGPGGKSVIPPGPRLGEGYFVDS